MSITSASTPGIEVHTFAKTSLKTASALGDQSSAASNEVIVPDAITSNNEGNLEASPSYVGRLIVLRPYAFLTNEIVQIYNPGSGYTVNDILDLDIDAKYTYLNDDSVTAKIKVDSVSNGEITALSIDRIGEYAYADFENTTSASYLGCPGQSFPYATCGPFNLLNGTGSGAKIHMKFVEGEEIRYITADTSNTLTVNEDWIVPPQSGSHWAIPYTIQDAATVTGLTFVSKSQIYESARNLLVRGIGTTDRNPAGFSVLDSVGWEINDNGTNGAGFAIFTHSFFYTGYIQNNKAVGGAYIFSTNDGDSEEIFTYCDGSTTQSRTDTRIGFYDLQWRSARANLEFNSKRRYDINIGRQQNLIKDSKFYALTDPIYLCGFDIDNFRLIGTSSTTNFVYIADDNNDIDNFFLISTNGLRSTFLKRTNFIVKNTTFLNNLINVNVGSIATWNFINPQGWIATSGYINFETQHENEARLLYSIDVNTLDLNASPIENSFSLIYEGQNNDFIPGHNQILSDIDGLSTINVVKEIYNHPSGLPFTTTSFGDFALKSFKYGYTPNLKLFTLSNARDESVFLSLDSNISETNQNIAISGGLDYDIRKQKRIYFNNQTSNFTLGSRLVGLNSGAIGDIVNIEDLGSSGVLLLDGVIGKFEASEIIKDSESTPGSASINGSPSGAPFNLIHFDNGTGTPSPAIGDVITGQTSGASGVLVELRGDSSTGYLLLEQRNLINWTNNETIDSNAGGTWASTIDTSGGAESTDLDFTWLIDGNDVTSSTLQKTYEYTTAKMADRIHPIVFFEDRDPTASLVDEVIFNDQTEVAQKSRFIRKPGEIGYEDVRILPVIPAINDGIYIGSENFFNKVYFDITLASSGSPSIQWEYYNGSAWIALSGVIDNTNNFLNIGMREVSFDLPNDWKQKQIVATKRHDGKAEWELMTPTSTVNMNLNETVVGASGATGKIFGKDELLSNSGNFAAFDVDGIFYAGESATVPAGSFNLTQLTNGETVFGELSLSSPISKTSYWVRGRLTSVGNGVRRPRADTISINKIFEDLHIWGARQNALPLKFGSNGYFTSRNTTKTEGVFVANHGAGTVDFWTSDSGATFVPPTQYTLTINGLQTNSEVRIYDSVVGKPTTERDGIENSGTSFQHNYVYSGSDISIIIVIGHLSYKFERIFATLSNSDQTITVEQVTDRVYSNP